MYKAKEITLPADFQRGKYPCKDGFQTKRPKEQPLIVRKYAITWVGPGEGWERELHDLRTYSPFYLLSQTKQLWGVDFGSGAWPAACGSVNEMKILSGWGEEGISSTNGSQKGLYYGQNDRKWQKKDKVTPLLMNPQAWRGKSTS